MVILRQRLDSIREQPGGQLKLDHEGLLPKIGHPNLSGAIRDCGFLFGFFGPIGHDAFLWDYSHKEYRFLTLLSFASVNHIFRCGVMAVGIECKVSRCEIYGYVLGPVMAFCDTDSLSEQPGARAMVMVI